MFVCVGGGGCGCVGVCVCAVEEENWLKIINSKTEPEIVPCCICSKSWALRRTTHSSYSYKIMVKYI